MAQMKLIAMVALAILGMIVVLQNTEPVNTRILLWSITMPRAVLLLGTTLIGFAFGVLASFFMGERVADQPRQIAPAPEKHLPEQD